MSRTYRKYPLNTNFNNTNKSYKLTKDFSFNSKGYRKFKKYIHNQIRNKIKINLKYIEDYNNFIPNKTIYI